VIELFWVDGILPITPAVQLLFTSISARDRETAIEVVQTASFQAFETLTKTPNFSPV
jgi:hypothetical protein